MQVKTTSFLSFFLLTVTVCIGCLSIGFSHAGIPAPSVAPAVELNTMWEISLGNDRTTTVTSTERDAHPPFIGLYYIPAAATDVTGTALPGVQIIYRLVNSQVTDHMDSLFAGEGGYSTEGGLGYVWSKPNAEFGLSTISRLYDGQSGTTNFGDHATTVENSPVPHAQVFTTYSPNLTLGNGYARYPGTDSALAWLSGGGVIAKTNLAVGCALWELWWNGIEFINDYDYGRELQVAMYPTDGPSSLSEAGDNYSGPSVAVDARHPSPCVTFTTGGSSVGPYMTTAAIPLDFSPATFGGGADNPVIYPAVRIGKSLTLDWIGPDGIDNNWPVSLFQTQITIPRNISEAVIEAPAGYLTAQFNTYYYYNLSTQVLTQVPAATVQGLSSTTGYDVPLPAGAQAIILASGTGTSATAMGVYINNPNSGFVFYDNSSGPSPGQSGSNFAKWEVRYDSTVAAGLWTYKTWIITDTVANVKNRLNQLYTWGVTSR